FSPDSGEVCGKTPKRRMGGNLRPIPYKSLCSFFSEKRSFFWKPQAFLLPPQSEEYRPLSTPTYLCLRFSEGRSLFGCKARKERLIVLSLYCSYCLQWTPLVYYYPI